MYFVARSNNRYDLPKDGINVFEVHVIERQGQSPTVEIKKILIGGVKHENKRMGTSGSRLFKEKKHVIREIFNL